MALRWSEAEVSDQSGRVAVVTGGNAGLGFATGPGARRAGRDRCVPLSEGSTGVRIDVRELLTNQ